MIFENIEKLVLANIKRYTTSIPTATKIILDMNINRAINDIAQNILAERMIETTTITTEDRTASLNAEYSIPSAARTLFDRIMKVRYKQTNNSQWDLERTDFQNIRQIASDMEETGRPAFYRLIGNTGNAVDMAFYPVTGYAGEVITIEYLPIFQDLSAASDVNIITRKYATPVVNIATLYSEKNIVHRKDVTVQSIMLVVKAIATEINSREQFGPDYNYNLKPPQVLIARRKNRRRSRRCWGRDYGTS